MIVFYILFFLLLDLYILGLLWPFFDRRNLYPKFHLNREIIVKGFLIIVGLAIVQFFFLNSILPFKQFLTLFGMSLLGGLIGLFMSRFSTLLWPKYFEFPKNKRERIENINYENGPIAIGILVVAMMFIAQVEKLVDILL